MSICASGSSVAKSGYPSAVIVDSAYVKSLLPQALVWLYDFLPLMKAVEIGNVGAFCALDPPAWTLPSADDWFAFATGGPLGQKQVVDDFLGDIVRHYLWHEICECSSGTTPAPTSAPSAPSGLPEINPDTIVQPPFVDACVPFDGGSVIVGNGQTYSRGGPDGSYRNVTYVTTTVQTTIQSGAGCAVDFVFKKQTPAAGGITTIDTISLPAVYPPFTKVLPYDPLKPVIWCTVTGTAGAGNSNAIFRTDMYCDNALPTDRVTPCCPPDPLLVGRIKQILDMVTLIQRQSTPFAYVYGANHTGISGSGELAVQGLIGASIDVTTLPGSYGSAAGNPDLHFGLGFIQLGTADGFSSSRPVDFDGTLMIPPAAGLYTRIGYSLRPGVVVSIRELVREP